MIMNSVLRIDKLCKNYYSKEGIVVALDDISLDINEGEYVAIVGPSGCGKSTLLNIIGGIDSKSSGIIEKDNGIKIGYMLQNDCLFPWINILDNCLLGLKINGDYNNDNGQVIDNNTLVAITLLIAQSNPKEKDVLIDLVMNFLND